MSLTYAPRLAPDQPSSDVRPAAANDEILVTVQFDWAALESEWRRFESQALGHVYQCFDWFSLWYTAIGAEEGITPAIVLGRSPAGDLLFLLPLGIQRRSGASALVWLGGEQADVKAGLFAPAFLEGFEAAEWHALWTRILDRLPPFDLICLEDQPERIADFPNPFLAAKTHVLADHTHASRLSADWQSYYKTRRSSAARNLDRRRMKQLQALGPVKFEIAEDARKAQILMQRLLDEKSRGLAEMGVADPFAGPVRDFYARLTAHPYPGGHVQVSALTLNGEPVSIVWALLFNRRFYYLVCAYDPEYSKCSPGRVHLTELFRWACEHGFRHFDLGVGDQEYKSQWCEQQVAMFSTIQPRRGMRGQLVSRQLGAKARLKRQIKTSTTLWPLAQAVRARLAAIFA